MSGWTSSGQQTGNFSSDSAPLPLSILDLSHIFIQSVSSLQFVSFESGLTDAALILVQWDCLVVGLLEGMMGLKVGCSELNSYKMLANIAQTINKQLECCLK